MVANRAAQAFPWELILNDVTTRAYALVHVLGRERAHLCSRGREQSVVPAFHSFFFPTVDKHRRAEEDRRARLLATRLLAANKLAVHVRIALSLPLSSSSSLFSSPSFCLSLFLSIFTSLAHSCMPPLLSQSLAFLFLRSPSLIHHEMPLRS